MPRRTRLRESNTRAPKRIRGLKGSRRHARQLKEALHQVQLESTLDFPTREEVTRER